MICAGRRLMRQADGELQLALSHYLRDYAVNADGHQHEP